MRYFYFIYHKLTFFLDYVEPMTSSNPVNQLIHVHLDYSDFRLQCAVDSEF